MHVYIKLRTLSFYFSSPINEIFNNKIKENIIHTKTEYKRKTTILNQIFVYENFFVLFCFSLFISTINIKGVFIIINYSIYVVVLYTK